MVSSMNSLDDRFRCSASRSTMGFRWNAALPTQSAKAARCRSRLARARIWLWRYRCADRPLEQPRSFAWSDAGGERGQNASGVSYATTPQQGTKSPPTEFRLSKRSRNSQHNHVRGLRRIDRGMFTKEAPADMSTKVWRSPVIDEFANLFQIEMPRDHRRMRPVLRF